MNPEVDRQLKEVFEYYRNLLTLAPNLYSLTFRVTPDKPDMLQLQMWVPPPPLTAASCRPTSRWGSRGCTGRASTRRPSCTPRAGR